MTLSKRSRIETAVLHLLWVVGFIVSMLGISLAAEACNPFGKAVARTALDVVTATCIVANADRPDAEVKAICGVVDAIDDPMRELLKTSREQTKLARSKAELASAARCSPDGGR
jgi:hypothetical protein